MKYYHYSILFLVLILMFTACLGEGLNPKSAQTTVTTIDPSLLPRLDRLVGYWKMENNWNDSSGRNNHGAPAGGSPVFTTTAKVGIASANFNGSSYVSVPDSPSLEIDTTFTMMTWIFVAAPQGVDFWLFSKNAPGFASGYGIAFDHNTGQVWPHLGIGGGLQNPKATGSVNYGQWTLIAVTYDGSAINIYLNGAFDSTLAVTGLIGTSNDNFYIANSPGSPGQYLLGYIDNLALWNTYLTPAEIQDIYIRQFSYYSSKRSGLAALTPKSTEAHSQTAHTPLAEASCLGSLR